MALVGDNWVSRWVDEPPIDRELARQEALREKLGRTTPRTEEERWRDAVANHPAVLPLEWPETARSSRERSLYVDLGENGWTTPKQTGPSEFQRVRPLVARRLQYLRAAYEREIVAAEEMTAG